MAKLRVAPEPAFPSGETLLDNSPDFGHASVADLVHQLHKWTRLTTYTLSGLLADMDGSVLNKEDVDLAHQVAYVADSYAHALEMHMREHAGRDPRARPAVA